MAVEIFKLFGSIFVNNDEANKSISDTDKKAKNTHSTLGSGIKTAAKWGAAVLGAATGAVTGLTKMATSAASTADNVDKMSQKIGISRQSYQELDFICSQSGTSVDKLQAGMKSLVSAMDGASSGNANNIEQFKKLGVSVEDANGNLRNSEDVMWETFTALQSMDNQTEKTRLATELFGKSGIELMPMLNGTSGSIDEMKQKAHDLGLVLGDETIDAGVSLTDTMDQMKRSVGAVFTQLGAKLMPILEKVCNAIISYMPQIQSFIDQLAPVFKQFFDNIMPKLFDIGGQILPIIIDLLAQFLPVISTLFEALAPIIEYFIGQLLPALMQFIEQIMPAVLSVIEAIIPLIETIFALIQPFIDVFIQLLKPIATLITNAIAPLIEKFAVLLNNFLQPLIPVFQDIANIILETLSPVFNQLSPIFDKVSQALEPIFELLGMLLNEIIPLLVPIIQNLADVFTNILGSAIDCVSGVLDNIMVILGGLIDFISGVFSGNWEQAWNGIVDVFKGIFNSIPTIMEFIINGAIGLINGLLSGINWAVEWIGWDIPTIPEVTLPRFRAGIDYVPNDKFAAYLDAGEAVLNAQEAEEYRKSKRNSYGSPFSGVAKEKIVNVTNYIEINIPNVNVQNDTDIKELSEELSERLAAEIEEKMKKYE